MIFLSLLSYSVLFGDSFKIEIVDKCSKNQTSCPIAYKAKQSSSSLKLIINTWVFMFAVEEFRQVNKVNLDRCNHYVCFLLFLKLKLFKTRENSIRQALMLYLDETWNKLDVLCIIVYLMSIFMELWNSKLTLNAARFNELHFFLNN